MSSTSIRGRNSQSSLRLRRFATVMVPLVLLALAPVDGAAASSSDAPLLALAPANFSNDRTLSFEDRVEYQRRLEEVYWKHRIWPAENPGPKPPLDAVFPRTQIRAKVEDYLKKSKALETLWGRPITAEQLQAEMERMARQSRAPGVLRELFDALGNDPFVIAETLARQTLADRMIRSWYARDERFHGALRREAEAALEAVSSGVQLRSLGARYSEITWKRKGEAESGPERKPDEIALDADAWRKRLDRLADLLESQRSPGRAISTGPRSDAERLAALPLMTVGTLEERDEAFFVSSVVGKRADAVTVATASWTKVAFDAWWAEQSVETSADLGPTGGEFILAEVATDGGCVPDTWAALPVEVEVPPTSPGARFGHTAVWTGAEMIVWGGIDDIMGGTALGSGGRYNPSTDTWVLIVGGRSSLHTAVWTGSEMIVWGGDPTDNTGGRYDPATDRWQATTTTGAPSARYGRGAR